MKASEEAADAVEEVADRVEALQNGHKGGDAAEGQGSVKLENLEGDPHHVLSLCYSNSWVAHLYISWTIFCLHSFYLAAVQAKYLGLLGFRRPQFGYE